jgi:alpha-tubulin suppressor-like RCC1 family protein
MTRLTRAAWGLVCVVVFVVFVPRASAGATVSGGEFHTVLVKPDGSVWAWGINSSGQLGDGTTTQKTVPTLVSGISDVVAVAAGGTFTLALKSDGTVWAWGANTYGQLGDGTNSPHLTPSQISWSQ